MFNQEKSISNSADLFVPAQSRPGPRLTGPEAKPLTEKFRSDVQDRVNYFRLDRCLTQTTCAVLLDVSQTTISNIKNGHHVRRDSMILRLDVQLRLYGY